MPKRWTSPPPPIASAHSAAASSRPRPGSRGARAASLAAARVPRRLRAHVVAERGREAERWSGHKVSMLGTGLIGDFYTMTLHGQRGRDRVARRLLALARSAAQAFASAGRPASRRPTSRRRSTTRTPTSSSSGCRTTCTRRRSRSRAAAGKAVLCTKPLGRTAEEAQRMLDTVERPASSPATSRTSSTRRRRSRRSASVQRRGDRRRDSGSRSRETHPGPAQRLVLGRRRRPAAARSSTSAATASRSSATSSARATGRSR